MCKWDTVFFCQWEREKEFYIQYRWQPCDGERKSGLHRKVATTGEQMKRNTWRWYSEKRGYCVLCRWQAGGRGVYICLWHQQLKAVTCALFLWPSPLSLYAFLSPPFSIDVWHCSIFCPQVPTDGSGYLSQSSFSLLTYLHPHSSLSFYFSTK